MNTLIGQVNKNLYSVCLCKLNKNELIELRDKLFTKELTKERQYDVMLSSLWSRLNKVKQII